MAVRKIHFKSGRTVSLKGDFMNGLSSTLSEHIVSHKGAVYLSGFKYKSGALENGIGLTYLDLETDEYIRKHVCDNFKLNNEITFVAYYNLRDEGEVINDKKDLLYISDSANNVYVYNMYCGDFCDLDTAKGQLESVGNLGSKILSACNYNYNGKDVLLVIGEDGKIRIFDGLTRTHTEITDMQKVAGICICGERVFLSFRNNKRRIWFSKQFDPTYWNVSLDGAGYIELSGEELGEVVGITSIGNYVYAIREYGITKIYGVGDQRDFMVTTLYRSTALIFGKTAQKVGTSLVFATDSGVFRLADDTVSLLNKDSDTFVTGGHFVYAKAMVFKNKYYLAYRRRTLGLFEMLEYGYYAREAILANEAYNDTLLILGLDDGEVQMLPGLDISAMSGITAAGINRSVFSLRGINRGLLLSECADSYLVNKSKMLTKRYISGIITLGLYEKKFLKGIKIYSESDIELIIYADAMKKSFFIKGGAYEDIKTSIAFTEMRYEISSNAAKDYILPPQFEIKIY